MHIFSSAMSRNEFSTNSMAQYQNFSADTSMTVSAPLHVADPRSTDSSNLSILFILLSSLPGRFPLLALFFSTSTFLSKTIGYQRSLQTHRFAQLFASFLIPSASRKKFAIFFFVVTDALERVHNISRETALKPSESKSEDRIPLTITYHPNNLRVKDIILKNFKLLQSDPDTATIFEKPPLVSFKRDKSLRNSLVKGSLSTELEPGTFKCSRKRCNTCPFITNTVSISGPKNSTQITDHFDCTSRNVIYCIRCTACNQLYIGETGRRLGDRFREHLLDVKNNSQDVSKPVARHFNQPGHSHNNMKIFGLSLHQGNTESRKCTEQRLIFKIGTLSPAGINERFSFS